VFLLTLFKSQNLVIARNFLNVGACLLRIP